MDTATLFLAVVYKMACLWLPGLALVGAGGAFVAYVRWERWQPPQTRWVPIGPPPSWRFKASGSDTHGGWWARFRLPDATDGRAVAAFTCGWGFDVTCPLRPWPTFHAERRTHDQVLAWVAWCGFFLAAQTRPLERP